MKIFIDKQGKRVSESEKEYILTLTGSVRYSFYHKGYLYEVKKVEPQIPLKYYFSEIEIEIKMKEKTAN